MIVGKNPLEDWVAIIVKKCSKCSTWMQSQKQQNISVHFQGKPFNITVIEVYAPTSNAEEAELNSSVKTYKIF